MNAVVTAGSNSSLLGIGIFIVVIVAMGLAYNGWKYWVRHKYPTEEDDDED